MSQHIRREIDTLKKKTVQLCTLVEENFSRSLRSLKEQNAGGIEDVKEYERIIDQTEIDLEEECLKILALHQPVAVDLRYIIAILKINNDLERIGDMACHISERYQFVNSEVGQKGLLELSDCAQNVKNMLRMSLDALIDQDVHLARKVQRMDGEINKFHDQFFHKTVAMIQENPSYCETWMNLLFISKQLERIGDHATNIAEDVVYSVEGSIIRHQSW